VIPQSFQELYSAKTDDELLALAADSGSLREDAKSVLAQELQRRNLQQPQSHHKVESRHGNSTSLRALLFVGALLLNTAIALLFTPVAEKAGIAKMFHPPSLAGLLLEWWILDFVCATGLGFSISRLWRNKSATWTWILPVLWFAFGFLGTALSGRSIWSLFSGSDCINSLRSIGCRNFIVFTLPLVRGVSYSLGAYIAALRLLGTDRLSESVTGTSS